MTLAVVLTAEAERDLEDLDDYLVRHAGTATADAVLSKLERRCAELAEFPDRGNIPPEVASIGITEYRELHKRPYRIIYRLSADRVTVYVVADAR